MNRIRVSGLVTTVVLLGASTAGILVFPRPRSSNRNTGGEITGKISFRGEHPKLAMITMDRDRICASLHGESVYAENGEVNSNDTLPNVFVYVKAGLHSDFPVPKSPVILDQRGCIFVPHVLGIMVGQELRVLTSDPTVHNVHALAAENRQWNESQIPGAAPLVKRFTRPEVMVPLDCNIHPWMKAYIGVTTNPFYAVTGQDGVFTIKGIPAGDYALGAWTAAFGTQERTVTVPPGGSVIADFTFSPSQ